MTDAIDTQAADEKEPANEAKRNKRASRTEPTLLSYERSVHPTDGVFVSIGTDGTEAPIEIFTKTVLGTHSQFNKNPADVEEYANPQRVEIATLPVAISKYKIVWNVTFTGASLAPHACDLPGFRARLTALTSAYARQDRYVTIAHRIAQNIANGRWAWRNRLFAESFVVNAVVRRPNDGQKFTFDALAEPIDGFEKRGDNVSDLGEIIARGLRGEGLVRISVDGVIEAGANSTIFPSQEFVDRDDRDKTAVGKVLYGVHFSETERCAALHEQKIGNALRTFDTWHNGAETDGVVAVAPGEPLPVNPYGQARNAYVVVRRRRDASGAGNPNFYDLLKKDLDKMIDDAEAGKIGDDIHFVVANLLRGGVFGMKGDN